MIAIWIVGCSAIVIGVIVGIVPVIKLLTYKGETRGQITKLDRSSCEPEHSSVRVYYKFTIGGVEYQGRTGWIDSGVFSLGRECDVRYQLRNPSKSYMRNIGTTIKCFVGLLGFLVGTGTIAIGLYLSAFVL